MDIDDVEKCLKAAKKSTPTPPTPRGKSRVNPTALAAQLAFDNNPAQIDEVLSQLEHEVDERPNRKKADRIDVIMEEDHHSPDPTGTTESVSI